MEENPFERIANIKNTLSNIDIRSKKLADNTSKEELVSFKSVYYSLTERTHDRMKELVELNDRILYLEQTLNYFKEQIKDKL